MPAITINAGIWIFVTNPRYDNPVYGDDNRVATFSTIEKVALHDLREKGYIVNPALVLIQPGDKFIFLV